MADSKTLRSVAAPPTETDPQSGDWSRYKNFWDGVGDNFPDLGQARSTADYRLDEQRLFRDHLAPLEGSRIFKTDLWDEVKNTRILRWAADQDACCYGVDISLPIVRQAHEGFGTRRLRAPVSDVRHLPFREGSFDAIYSMGTVEHFDETDAALSEIFRVLRPGGRAVIGVPNRWDPFLRPLMVAILYRLGLYGYGFEKSYSRKGLRRMMARAGFEVVAEDGILFIPGWLRILDLACHTWFRPASRITGALSAFFGRLARRYPWLHRHGYLIAAVGRRPSS
jgi:SAM-dependent methyltransferase